VYFPLSCGARWSVSGSHLPACSYCILAFLAQTAEKVQ
jgi:hypothetical protein